MFAIFSYKLSLDTFVFDMGVNSIRAYKLSAIVPRILNKKEAFISRVFLHLCSSSLIVLFDDNHFSPIFLKVKI